MLLGGSGGGFGMVLGGSGSLLGAVGRSQGSCSFFSRFSVFSVSSVVFCEFLLLLTVF